MKYWIIYINLLVFARYTASAQCPDRTEIYSRMNSITKNPDQKLVISGLNKLALLCRKCNVANDSTYAKILHISGRTLWHENKLDSAMLLTRQAIQVNSGKSVLVSEANLCHSYFNLACIYSDKGDLKMAVSALDNAIKSGLKFPEKAASVSGSYNKLANIYTSQGNYEKTLSSADLGYIYAEKADRKDLMAKSLMEKSQGLIELNRLEESEKVLSESLKMASEYEDEALKGSIYSMLAELKKKQNKPGEVISYFHKSFEAFKKDGFAYGCGQAASNLGYYYEQKLHDFSKALENHNLALSYMPEELGRAVIIGNIANVYKNQADYQKALFYFQKALLTAPIHFKIPENEQNPSAVLIKETLDKAALFSIIQDKADAWLYFGKHTQNDRIKLKNALKTYMLADTMVDYMRWEHAGNITKLFWRDKTRSMYEHAIETCYLLNDPENAFYFFEKSRAVMLNDQLNELGANQLLKEEIQIEEKILKQKVTDLQNRLIENADDRKIASKIRSKLFAAQEAQEVFIRKIEKSNPQYYTYKYDNHVPDIAKLRSKILVDNQTFISYFVGDSAVYGLGIMPDKMVFRKMDLSDYNHLTAEFQKLIGNRDAQNRQFKAYLSVSFRLYQLLIQPFHIDANTRVIISPDGSFLPFETLSVSADVPDYLVKKYAFSYTYSAGFLAKSLRSKETGFSTKSFLGLAPVQFAPALSQASLPGSDIVLKAINKYFFFSKTLTGNEASRNAFVTESPDYRVVQLLTHATADSSDTVPTLYFADSTLKLNELSSSRKSGTELLILSACRTGVGKNQRGEGVFSLARGFAGVGIPSVLTTLWSVENESVYSLTKLFYAELEKGTALDVALQHAQIEWLKTASSSDRLPYTWAGMVVVGNSEPVSTGISKPIGYVLTGLVLILFVFLLFFIRRRLAVH